MLWVHIGFKIKYCHPIFDYVEVRDACSQIFESVACDNCVEIMTVGFDANHVHFIVDLVHFSEPHLKKLFKCPLGRKLLRRFSCLSKNFFGVLGVCSIFNSIGSDMRVLSKYVNSQKFFVAVKDPAQQSLQRYYPV